MRCPTTLPKVLLRPTVPKRERENLPYRGQWLPLPADGPLDGTAARVLVASDKLTGAARGVAGVVAVAVKAVVKAGADLVVGRAAVVRVVARGDSLRK